MTLYKTAFVTSCVMNSRVLHLYTVVLHTSHFLFRRRFPWNCVLLAIFVSIANGRADAHGWQLRTCCEWLETVTVQNSKSVWTLLIAAETREGKNISIFRSRCCFLFCLVDPCLVLHGWNSFKVCFLAFHTIQNTPYPTICSTSSARHLF